MDEINLIFPTPVFRSTLDKKLTNKELNFVKHHANHCQDNEGNFISIDKNILDNIAMKNIKKFINEKLNDYFQKVYSPKNNNEIYITQSWLNYTNKNEYHHRHRHPCSFISGVFYFEADKSVDKIEFFHSDYDQIVIETNEPSKLNSKAWFFPVNQGDLILFPSSLEHRVPKTTNPNTRVSLAFNTFVNGILGNKMNSTELILK